MLKQLYGWFSRLFIWFTKPVSLDKDLSRREFILNILLLAAILLAIVCLIASVVTSILVTHNGDVYSGIHPIVLFIILVFFSVLYSISRMGKARWVAYLLLTVYFAISTYTCFRWGVDVPQALLTYALTIVMAGILISSHFSFFVTTLSIFSLSVIFYLNNIGKITSLSAWRQEKAEVIDIIIYGVTLFIIATVSWLFNREMEKSLIRARASERALKEERDSLEVRVEERTQELKEAQIQRMTQVYKFAELGKLASGLFHDLTNPIMLVSLSLDLVNEKTKMLHQKEMALIQEHLKRAVMGTKKLETFMLAARKNIQNHDISQKFSLQEELQQVIQIVHHKARTNFVQIVVEEGQNISMYGNPIKFHQLMLNLISNAIDAYPKLKENGKKNRFVRITFQKQKGIITITVKDTGIGILPKNLPYIFEPLFTTKSSEKGTGLGLAICKEIIEKYFNGFIDVESKVHEGTTFSLRFPHKSASGKVS